MNKQELWDWCGCDFRHKWEYKAATCGQCSQARDFAKGNEPCYPELTLANLYRHAIPKMQGAGYIVTLISYEHTGYECRVESVLDTITHTSGIVDDPGDAILRAIEKTI